MSNSTAVYEVKQIPACGLLTDRLLIRFYQESDVDSLYKMLSDKRVFEYILDEPMEDYELVRKYTKACSGEQGKKCGRLIVVDKYTNKFIGTITIHRRAASLIELGFTLPVENWGNGYATEIVKGITDYYSKDYDIILKIFADNKASRRVAEKLGYDIESTIIDTKDNKKEVIYLYKYHSK